MREKKLRRIQKNRKGLTPVVSTLLLMVIATAAMSLAVAATYVVTDSLHYTMGERYIIEDVWFTTGEITIYLRNIGKVPIQIVALYLNHTPQSIPPFQLEVGEHAWLNTTHTWNSTVLYHLNLVSSRGTKVADSQVSPA
jgi:hypothetical protein